MTQKHPFMSSRDISLILNLSRFMTLFLIVLLLGIGPLYAQEEEEFFEGEFDEEFLDEEEGFFDDEDAFLEDDEFNEDEFFDEEGDLEFGGEAEEEAAEEEFDEGDTRQGYTIQISGVLPGMPGKTSAGASVFYPTYKNSSLAKWISPTPFFRVSVDFPFYFEFGSIGFRAGLDVGMASFETDPDVLPIGGKFGGLSAFGVVTVPIGVTNLRFGAGIVGTSPAYMASQSFGFALGPALDVRFGLRATTAYNPPDEIKRDGTHASWVDGFVSVGLTL